MQDKKNIFPPNDPPAEGGTSGQNSVKPVASQLLPDPQLVSVPTISQSKEPELSSILLPPSQTVPQTLPLQQAPIASPAPISVSTTPALPKSKFPKIALIAALGILVLSILGFIVVKLLGTNRIATPSGPKGEITWWGLDLPETVANEIISDYQNGHADVKITYVKQSPDQYRERLTNALAKGGGPDIFEIHNSWVPMFKNDLSILPTSVMSSDEYKAAFYSVAVQDFTDTRGIVGIPLFYDAITLYVNEDILSSALKPVPKTWIDIQQLADTTQGLTQKDESGKIIQSGIALGTTDNVEYWPEIIGLMLYQNKASFLDPENTNAKDVFLFYQNFAKTEKSWDSTLPTSTLAFARQKTAMIIAPASAAAVIMQDNPNLHFKTYPLPQLPKESSNTPDIAYATYWGESVGAKSANKDTAWDFLKFASSQEVLQKTNQSLKVQGKLERAYPRPAMNGEFAGNPILGSIVSLAGNAKSWYLYDHTNDGATGINTQLKDIYAGLLTEGADAKTIPADITKVLTQYGISMPK